MSLSPSPRPLPAAEPSCDLSSQENQALFCTDIPLRTQLASSLASARLSEEPLSMATAHQALPLSQIPCVQQAPLDIDSDSMQWSAEGHFPRTGTIGDPTLFCSSAAFALGSPNYYQQGQNGMAYNTNYSHAFPRQYPSPSCPRLYDGIDFTGLPNDVNTTASYPPASFFHEPPRHDTMSLPDSEANCQLMQLNDDYDHHYGSHIKLEEHDEYSSPYSDMSRASTPYDESSRCDDDNPIDKEQPYAQLIYRALLDAPNHTMILRDIYDWFRLHTDKASQSETKGWQNSIRHNLSMNGAFEKVDQPTEDSRKGFMWRLTSSALREGVKSTTRYRSKAPNKRSARTQPLPQRQASGAKGGHAARRTAHLRRSQRARDAYRSDPRSDPYDPFVSEEYGTANTTEISFPARVDSPYPQYGNDLSYHMPRQSDFKPMLGMARHLMSPPRSYASTNLGTISQQTATYGSSTPMTQPVGDAAYVLDHNPGEPLFTGSPTPSVDDPLTPNDRRGGWGEDVSMGVDMYDNLGHRGHGV